MAKDVGSLSQQHKAQILQWLGRDRASVELLYSARRDGGLSAETFHRLCDGRRPTITIAKNTTGYVFGGFTTVAWHKEESYSPDKDAFLFRLAANNTFSPKKATILSNRPTSMSSCDNAIYGGANYGPVFGGGHDWYSFSGSINLTGRCFHGNGSCQIGSYFQGLDAQAFNGNNQDYAEFEVYEIQDLQVQENPEESSPWRKEVSFQRTDLDRLIVQTTNYRPRRDLNIRYANILLTGEIGAGKSSFYNTLQSIFTGYVVNKATVGRSNRSVTTKLRKYDITPKNGIVGVKICDTMGLDEEGGLGVIDFPYILDGNIPDKYQFNPAARVTPKVAGFIKEPTLVTMTHCVAYVIDGTTIASMTNRMITNFKTVKDLVNERNIPLVVLLTKIDEVCPYVKENTSLAMKSPTIHEIVQDVTDKLGVPKSSVMPVRNYESELDLELNINILALVALRQILRSADVFFQEQR